MRASPTPSSVMAFATSRPGLARKVSAAERTAFWSRGVKARKRVLHAVPQLAQDRLRDVQRVLGDEVHAHALGPDEPHDLLDLVLQRLGCVLEQEVSLVEEEDELRLFQIADLREVLVQLGQHPEQEGGVELGRLHELVGGENVHHARPAGPGLDQVVQVQSRFAKKASAPCSSSVTRPRWMAPMLAAEMLPYSVLNCAAFSHARTAPWCEGP